MTELTAYRNGNYLVHLYDDGTKVRVCSFDHFEPEFPETIDVKITNQCDMGCPYCHEDSTPDGEHGNIFGYDFLRTLPKGVELALGGGNPMTHPQLSEFLAFAQSLGLYCNITMNSEHLRDENTLSRLRWYQMTGLIKGIGVSVSPKTPLFVVRDLCRLPNAVAHVINGVTVPAMLQALLRTGATVLILGYKELRRGASYLSPTVKGKQTRMYNALPDLAKIPGGTIVFDNLAIKQLEPQRLIPEPVWKERYMGNEGQFSMYIDLVKGEYARSSTADERHAVTGDIREMFCAVKPQ